ncbi:MAG: hypothetical protein Q9184_007822 [Pyrenodesmia sp. 2 TL-2023]
MADGGDGLARRLSSVGARIEALLLAVGPEVIGKEELYGCWELAAGVDVMDELATELPEELIVGDASRDLEEEGMDPSVLSSAAIAVREAEGVEADEAVEGVESSEVVEVAVGLGVTKVLEVFEKTDEVKDSKFGEAGE